MIQKKHLKRVTNEGLSNPRRAAREIIKQMQKGEKVNIAKAMRDVGYAKSSAYCNHKVTKKEGFKEELFDFVKEMENERRQCLRELKDPAIRDKATYRDRIDAINKLTQNIQLITGQSTSNETMTIVWGNEEDADKD